MGSTASGLGEVLPPAVSGGPFGEQRLADWRGRCWPKAGRRKIRKYVVGSDEKTG